MKKTAYLSIPPAFWSLLACLVFFCAGIKSVAAAPDGDAAEAQSMVERIVRGVYSGDVDTIVSMSHPKVIEMAGGVEAHRTTTTAVLAQVSGSGMRLESFTFPADPVFVRTAENEYIVVPTKSVVTMNAQRVESLNYQFGNRKRGESKWAFIEGSRVTKESVGKLFEDFPKEFNFPEVYRKRINGGTAPQRPPEFAAYHKVVTSAIKEKWQISGETKGREGLGTSVLFGIDSSGRITDVSVEKGSGVPEYDESVLIAIKAANPLPPPPPSVAPYFTRVRIYFDGNF